MGAVVLGWITIEMACKPCLETGRRALDPSYDPDDSSPPAPTNANDLSTATPAKAI
jgi:hypothetical protein